MQRNILITGGLGYVGGRLSKYLSSQGNQVFALSRGKREIGLKNITVLSNYDVLEKSVLTSKKIDVVIHLAATNEIICHTDPKLSNDVNINGTLEWLEWSKRNKVNHFIYFSTVHVYDRPLIGEYSESFKCSPAHPYSITHKAAEDYVNWYSRDFNLSCSIIRLSNSFGSPAFNTTDRWSLFVNDICRQIVENKKIEIRSNRKQQRDFICLFDVCTAVETIMGQNIELNDSSNQASIYNLSKGSSKTLMDMALFVKSVAEELLNEKINLKFDKSKDIAQRDLVISNQKLKELGWTSSSSLERSEIVNLLDFITKHKSL